jgi:NitT/TauT family transport system ATP-binding protein
VETALLVEDLSFSFGSHKVLDGLSLEIEEGLVTCLLGPSGCGKTTLLKLLAGLPLAGGRIERGRIQGTGKTSFVFQEPRLLPWRTVYQNMDLVLQGAIPSAAERQRRILEILKRFELEESAASFPRELSGGMRQRAALARALLYPADYLFMDEPFQGLDPLLKQNLINDFLSHRLLKPQTALLVTHDTREAALLGDRIFLLSPRPGRLCLRLENPLNPPDRNRENPSLSNLAEQLYRAMTGRGGRKF